MSTATSHTDRVESIFERVRGHAFHPLDDDRFTVDRHLGRHGIADLNDPDWKVRLAYFGTYWGDRPTIEQTLEMIRNDHFDFEYPERLKAAVG